MDLLIFWFKFKYNLINKLKHFADITVSFSGLNIIVFVLSIWFILVLVFLLFSP